METGALFMSYCCGYIHIKLQVLGTGLIIAL